MRVKEQMLQNTEVEFGDDLSFAEYLQHYMAEPTEAELDDMEQELNTKSTLSFSPLNNPYYHPLKGA
jgi:hypothetical protein